MRLTAEDLRAVADAVDKIKDLGLNVREVEVRGHKVLLDRTVEKDMDTLDRQERVKIFVVGMTTGELSGKEAKVMRDDAQPTYPGLPTGRRSGGFR